MEWCRRRDLCLSQSFCVELSAMICAMTSSVELSFSLVMSIQPRVSLSVVTETDVVGSGTWRECNQL